LELTVEQQEVIQEYIAASVAVHVYRQMRVAQATLDRAGVAGCLIIGNCSNGTCNVIGNCSSSSRLGPPVHID